MRKGRLASLVFLTGVGIWWVLKPAPPYVAEPIPTVDMRCFAETKPVPYSFCINRVRGSQSHDVVLHFHGRNGDATWWNDARSYSGEVVRRWAQAKQQAPIVVGVSFGALWLLDDSLMPVFEHDLMPRIEQELSEKPERLMAIGESMGGLNALLAGLKMPNRFSVVASLCAPLAKVSPFADVADLAYFVLESSTSIKRAVMMMVFSRQFYANDAGWRANHPVPLSQRGTSRSGTAFYITCGARDEWGCTEASEELVTTLRAHGASVVWVPRPGGHCDIEPNSLADALVAQ